VRREPLCRADTIAEGKGRSFRLGEGAHQLAVFVIRSGGALRGFVNSCPHMGTPLDWLPDRFFDRAGEHLLCGTHGALFRPEDGQCVRGPCLGKRLASLAVAVEDGVVVLDLKEPENS
jgi:nitrite reductase/ring-hydroxylating ferredoxin subunit